MLSLHSMLAPMLFLYLVLLALSQIVLAVRGTKTKSFKKQALKKQALSFYACMDVVLSSASTSTKSGYIKTSTQTHARIYDEDIPMAPPDNAPIPDNIPTHAPPLLDSEGPNLPGNISGIKVQPAKRYLNSDHPLLTWIDYRDSYLDAMIRSDGRGRHQKQGCVFCGEAEPTFQCRDCHRQRMACQICITSRHEHEPTHWLEAWTGTHFERTLMATLAPKHHYQLGHNGSSSCAFATPALKDFVIIHTNGLHSLVNIDFCGCTSTYKPYQQILDAGWFPATPLDPRSCATFDILHQFHVMNLQGKLSAFDFYKSLVLLTDPTGATKVPNRLPAFMIMAREWRHLKAAKQAGRGHDGSGIGSTGRGWENAPAELFHCVGFAALWLANNKKSKGLRATGVASFVGTSMGWAVPKFHLPPHKPQCHGPFALTFMPGVGRTDGEGVEQNWAWLNGAAPSTSQMGPGSRHDTLDDFMGFSNFRKTVDYDAIIHRQAFHVFSDALHKEHAAELVEWENGVKEWEKDKTKPDPFLIEEDSVSLCELERELAHEDYDKTKCGTFLNDISPSNLIISGLHLEDTQLSLRPEAAKKAQTSAQKTSLQRKRTSLLKKIRKFHDIQVGFIPGLSPVGYSTVPAEELPLRLPSSLTPEQCTLAPTLVSLEDRLREAHACQALSKLRRQLRLRTFALKFKDENAHSQGAYTRMRTLSNQIDSKICSARDQYNAAWYALFQLRGEGSWQDMYRVLRKEDIRGVNERAVVVEEEQADAWARAAAAVYGDFTLTTVSTLYLQTGEGHNTLSWIWYNVTPDDMNQDSDGLLHDGIRLEWLKARACAERWREEVILLDEEMRRVLVYTEWRASWWDEQASCNPTESPSLLEGLQAYAAEQAAIERSWLVSWAPKWAPVRE
ncbi:hypothetical protein DXG01_001266 [Tephrocybe rancida]|nr:hypothetical protein DXG01_001266 [Tephrocybe rancida]